MKIRHHKHFTYLYPLWLLLLISGCGVVDSNKNVESTDQIATAEFSYEVNITNQQRLILNGINGPIQIDGRPGISKVTIIGERRVGSETMTDAEDHLQELEVKVEDGNDQIVVQTIQPDQTRGRLYEVNYIIAVPDSMNIYVTDINGNIVISDMADTTMAQNINGEIELTNLTGNSYASVNNGTITSSINPPINGLLIQYIINGTINLVIPTSTSAEFEATNYNGSINLNNLNLQNPTQTNIALTGTLGAGEGSIVLGIVSGTINLTGY
ncbi:MAG TPA: hypothetical protein VJ991_10145 [Balneolales bacterium]|nr:hypothetical protein [Balneolales bacterium]